MRFGVPQFIEVEEKVFGPFTFKQAVYLGGACGILLILFTRTNFFLTILLGIPVLIGSLALGFGTMNGRPFVATVYAAFRYVTRNKLYLWKRMAGRKMRVDTATTAAPELSHLMTPKLSRSRLKEIAWSLDTQETLNGTS